MADNLCLKPVRENVLYIVLHHIFANGIDTLFRFQNITAGAVLFLNGEQLFVTAIFKQIFKGRVKLMLLIQSIIGGFAFIQNLQSSAIMNSVHQFVFINVITKALLGSLCTMALSNQRCAGKGNAGGVREGFKYVITEV